MPDRIDTHPSDAVRSAEDAKPADRAAANGRALSPARLAAVVQAAYLLEVRNR